MLPSVLTFVLLGRASLNRVYDLIYDFKQLSARERQSLTLGGLQRFRRDRTSGRAWLKGLLAVPGLRHVFAAVLRGVETLESVFREHALSPEDFCYDADPREMLERFHLEVGRFNISAVGNCAVVAQK